MRPLRSKPRQLQGLLKTRQLQLRNECVVGAVAEQAAADDRAVAAVKADAEEAAAKEGKAQAQAQAQVAARKSLTVPQGSQGHNYPIEAVAKQAATAERGAASSWWQCG